MCWPRPARPGPGPPASRRAGRSRSFRSAAVGVAVEGVDAPHVDVDVPAVDLAPEEVPLGIDRAFGDVDEPRAWAAVLARVPAIAAALQRLTEIERRADRADPPARGPRRFEKHVETAAPRARQRAGEQLDAGAAVVHGAVAVVKEAAAGGEIA